MGQRIQSLWCQINGPRRVPQQWGIPSQVLGALGMELERMELAAVQLLGANGLYQAPRLHSLLAVVLATLALRTTVTIGLLSALAVHVYGRLCCMARTICSAHYWLCVCGSDGSCVIHCQGNLFPSHIHCRAHIWSQWGQEWLALLPFDSLFVFLLSLTYDV